SRDTRPSCPHRPALLLLLKMPHNVALFITCLTDQFYPHVGVAVTKILEHFVCKVCFPETQTCCWQPFFNNGSTPNPASCPKNSSKCSNPTTTSSPPAAPAAPSSASNSTSFSAAIMPGNTACTTSPAGPTNSSSSSTKS